MLTRMIRNERGQELVEYAIVFIILMTLILGVIEFGILLFTQNSLSNAAREGARYAVVRNNQPYIPPSEMTKLCPGTAGSYPQIFTHVCNRIPGVPNSDDINVRVRKTGNALSGFSVEVRISFIDGYSPFFGIFEEFLPSGLPLGSQSTMRLE